MISSIYETKPIYRVSTNGNLRANRSFLYFVLFFSNPINTNNFIQCIQYTQLLSFMIFDFNIIHSNEISIYALRLTTHECTLHSNTTNLLFRLLYSFMDGFRKIFYIFSSFYSSCL